MATLRDWLQLFRTHTSPLEISIVTMGAVVALGTFFSPYVILWLVVGWLYHNAGYGQNSVEDFALGFDKDDPNKKHHPLQRGAISLRTARIGVYGLLVTFVLFSLVVSSLRPLGVFLLAELTIAGLLYNFIGKKIKAKPIPIAIAHTSLFPFAYFSTTSAFAVSGQFPFFIDTVSQVVVLGTIYIFIQIIYQILIAGDLKDIDQEEASLLKELGIYVKDGNFVASANVRALAKGLKIANVIPAFIIVYVTGLDILTLIIVAIFSAIILYVDEMMLKPRKWDHNKTTRDMAIMEVFTVFALIVALQCYFSWLGVLALIVFDILYFVVANRYLWKTALRPAV